MRGRVAVDFFCFLPAVRGRRLPLPPPPVVLPLLPLCFFGRPPFLAAAAAAAFDLGAVVRLTGFDLRGRRVADTFLVVRWRLSRPSEGPSSSASCVNGAGKKRI